MNDIDKSIHTAIGEYLVLAELLKRGHEVYLAHGPTQKGWDIIKVKSNTTIKIQVKTIDWPHKTAVNLNMSSLQFDILIIVLLNKPTTNELSATSKYLIIPKVEVIRLLSPDNSTRQDNDRTINVKKSFMHDNLSPLIPYLENWSCIIL